MERNSNCLLETMNSFRYLNIEFQRTDCKSRINTHPLEHLQKHIHI